jgi:hypothetical protein
MEGLQARMSYRTRYTLTIELLIGGKVAKLVDDAPIFALIDQLRNECPEATYHLDSKGRNSGDEGSWREHTRDLLLFSSNNQGILFTLHGEGEENADVWNEYFLNGKVQVAQAKMTIPPFDPDKLLLPLGFN